MTIRPMNAYIGTIKLLDDPRYIYEPKLDGYRALCYADGSLKFISRNGIDITANYPEFNFRKNIKAKSCVLDGEIVVFDNKGNPDFQLLQQGFKEAEYVVFDILEKNGKSLIHLPLKERKKILDDTVENSKRMEKISYSFDGHKLYKFITKRHLEGIMAKEWDAPYQPNKRSRVWLKIKAHRSVDAIIVGYTKSKRTVSSLALALYDDKNKLHYIGKVGTGFSEDDLGTLAAQFKKIESNKPALEGVVPLKKIIWLKPKLVAEVKYQVVTQAGILRISVFLRLRTDKNAQDCRYDQLKVMKKKK